jgi:hypothetical protein
VDGSVFVQGEGATDPENPTDTSTAEVPKRSFGELLESGKLLNLQVSLCNTVQKVIPSSLRNFGILIFRHCFTALPHPKEIPIH